MALQTTGCTFNSEGNIFEGHRTFWSWTFSDCQFRDDQELGYIACIAFIGTYLPQRMSLLLERG